MIFKSAVYVPREWYERTDFDFEKVRIEIAESLAREIAEKMKPYIEIECRGEYPKGTNLIQFYGELEVDAK